MTPNDVYRAFDLIQKDPKTAMRIWRIISQEAKEATQ